MGADYRGHVERVSCDRVRLCGAQIHRASRGYVGSETRSSAGRGRQRYLHARSGPARRSVTGVMVDLRRLGMLKGENCSGQPWESTAEDACVDAGLCGKVHQSGGSAESRNQRGRFGSLCHLRCADRGAGYPVHQGLDELQEPGHRSRRIVRTRLMDDSRAVDSGRRRGISEWVWCALGRRTCFASVSGGQGARRHAGRPCHDTGQDCGPGIFDSRLSLRIRAAQSSLRCVHQVRPAHEEWVRAAVLANDVVRLEMHVPAVQDREWYRLAHR